MKRDEKNLRDILGQYLPRYGPPRQEDVSSAVKNVWKRLEREASHASARRSSRVEERSPRRYFLVAVVAGVVLLFCTVMVQEVWWTSTIYAIGEVADGPMVRIAGGKAETIQRGDRVQPRDLLRSTEGGAVLSLSDGSKIEMRSQSELSLEKVVDGVQIRLNSGGVIVNAADQRNEQLYVQTSDVTASVLEGISLVNADKTGSRVAVIQGEALVRTGQILKALMSGEQVSTNPQLESQPVHEGIAWSRNMEMLLTLITPTIPQTPPREEPARFEVVSIRPFAPIQQGGGNRGGPGPAGPGGPAPFAQCAGLMAMRVEVTPGRFVATNAPVWGLIALAYGRTCPTPDVLVGMQELSRLGRFDIQANMPAGFPVYTRRQLNEGKAPILQQMLQTMLADRFKLVLRRETRDMPAYRLILVKEGKFKATELGPDGLPIPRPEDSYRPVPTLSVRGISMIAYAGVLQSVMGRTVIDKTGLTGLYDLKVEFPETAVIPDPNSPPVLIQDLIPERIEQQLGLKLEPVREPVEILTIEHVERPAEN